MTTRQLRAVRRLLHLGPRHRVRTIDDRLDLARRIVAEAAADLDDVEIWDSIDARDAWYDRLEEAEALVAATQRRVAHLLDGSRDLDVIVEV